MENGKIYDLVFEVIDDINSELPSNEQLLKTPSTALFGNSSSLDSLGLVNFVVLTEEKIEDQFGNSINLADEKALSQKNSPFRTIKTFVDYIQKCINENNE